jgi:hypothetical protein
LPVLISNQFIVLIAYFAAKSSKENIDGRSSIDMLPEPQGLRNAVRAVTVRILSGPRRQDQDDEVRSAILRTFYELEATRRQFPRPPTCRRSLNVSKTAQLHKSAAHVLVAQRRNMLSQLTVCERPSFFECCKHVAESSNPLVLPMPSRPPEPGHSRFGIRMTTTT